MLAGKRRNVQPVPEMEKASIGGVESAMKCISPARYCEYCCGVGKFYCVAFAGKYVCPGEEK